MMTREELLNHARTHFKSGKAVPTRGTFLRRWPNMTECCGLTATYVQCEGNMPTGKDDDHIQTHIIGWMNGKGFSALYTYGFISGFDGETVLDTNSVSQDFLDGHADGKKLAKEVFATA